MNLQGLKSQAGRPLVNVPVTLRCKDGATIFQIQITE